MKQVYIILLRAVNVSGKNIIKMADLKQQLELAGFGQVRTYIQSGNILLETDMTREKLGEEIRRIILEYFSLDIGVFVLTRDLLEKALAGNPFPPDAAPNRVFITFLNAPPAAESISKLRQIDLGENLYVLDGKVLYFYLPGGMATSKLSNNFFEQKLKVWSTGRNLNTVQKLLSLL